MVIVFSESLRKIVGDQIQFTLDEPVQLSDLLKRLSTQLAPLMPEGKQIIGNAIFSHILFFRQGVVLKLDDLIEEGDVLNVMLMVAGG